jgi:hypothetical protein
MKTSLLAACIVPVNTAPTASTTAPSCCSNVGLLRQRLLPISFMLLAIGPACAPRSARRATGLAPTAVVDRRYGQLLSNDPRLAAVGLISQRRGFSMLCGPASLENALGKIRRVIGLLPVDAVSDLEAMVPAGSPIVDGGIFDPDELRGFAVQKLAAMNISADVKAERIGAAFSVANLRQCVESKTVVLLGIMWWRGERFDPSKPWRVPPEMGHWVVVAGYDAADPHLFYLQDPLHTVVVPVTIRRAYPGHSSAGEEYTNQLVEYRNGAPYGPGRIALLGATVTITLR